MCARFEQNIGPAECNQLLLALGLAIAAPNFSLAPTIRPTDRAVVLSRERIFQASFGFHRAGKPMIINARSETVHERPSFRRLLDLGRTLVPMNGFYESGPTGTTLFSAPAEPHTNTPLILAAALVDYSLQSFVILTQEADDIVRPIHDRMPVLIRLSSALGWLADGAIEHDAITLDTTTLPTPGRRNQRTKTVASPQCDGPDPRFEQGRLE
jgi:putative SOS response-associated peptidase YedK